MHQWLRIVILGVAALSTAIAAENYKDIGWEDLLPGNNRPFIASHDGIGAAPSYPVGVVSALKGSKIRIPGFVVPLDVAGDDVRTMLLVPYFGACIHLPPPPANQVIYIEFAEPVTVESIWEPVWVSGKLSTEAFSSNAGDASYRLSGEAIEPYDY